MTIYLASIIALPIFFGIFCIIGAWSLGQDHQALKIALFLLSVISIFSSFHFASIVLTDINPAFSEMQVLLATTIKWITTIVWVIITYFLIYSFVQVTRGIAKKRIEKLEY